MKKIFGIKRYLYPQTVMVVSTYNADYTPNAMIVAWGGICGSNMVIVDAPGHKTTENVIRTGAFTIAAADRKYVAECDYVGIVSGENVPDKVERAGFTTVKSGFVNAPIINELPIVLECELIQFLESGQMLGRIINTSVEDSVLGEDGLPDISKFSPLTYDPVHRKYIALGEIVCDAYTAGLEIKNRY